MASHECEKQQLCCHWSIGMIAARLVAIRVWNHHTRIGEGSADFANRIQGH
jgi:hypothetical protein